MTLHRVEELPEDGLSTGRIPLLGQALCAGYPSPADDFLEGALDLQRRLVPNPPATFLWQIRGEPLRSASTTVTLPEATSDTLVLVKAARHGVAKTWRDQPERPWRSSKVGVVTTDLMLLEDSPRALIGQMDRERSGPRMAAIDARNARWGRAAVVPARAGVPERRAWSTKFEMRTPRYTTQVNELPVAVA